MRLSCAPLLFVALLCASGCRDGAASSSAPAPPLAEFIVAAGDSVYWISTQGAAIRMRGAPLELVRAGGRFYELYVADDDRSFEDAVLVGERVYRRDLLSGDSVIVYQDTLIPSLARQYARLHPDARPLGADDEANEEPTIRATGTLELGAIHGRYVSFSAHTDVERGASALWHTTHAGVIDLVEARPAVLADIAGAAREDVERQRGVALAAALDSVRASRDERGTRAVASLRHYRLDPHSFEITTIEGRPAVAFALPGAGVGDEGHLLSLSPIALGQPAWWSEVLESLPVASADGGRDVWRHGRYDVVVRYGPTGDAQLAIRDGTSREWSVGRIGAPATRVYWLDAPSVDDRIRAALIKAFQEAAAYDEGRPAAALTSWSGSVSRAGRRAGYLVP